MQGSSSIPFVRPARVGNFKIWRSKYQMSAYPKLDEEEAKRVVAEKGKVRKEKIDVECINVSNVEGTWKVQVPSTFEMFGVLSSLYSDYTSANMNVRERAKNVFFTVLGNMMYASCIGNGYYHRALDMVATCYAHPKLLTEDDAQHADLLRDLENLVKDFLAWREKWDAAAAANNSEEADKRDEIAEQAQEIIGE